MSTCRLFRRIGRAAVLATTVSSLAIAPVAAAELLKPFKDDLFAYPGILREDMGGDYRVVDYDEMRDINGRDDIPERRAGARYVSTAVRRVQEDLALRSDVGVIRHVAVGATENAPFITLYLHGQGGSRKQGVDDFTFGGNFNRLKNLVAAAGGLYLTPDFTDFGATGKAQVAALLQSYAAKSPGAPLIVACGSAGGAICWGLARDAAIGTRIAGLVLLGSFSDESFVASAAFRRKTRLFLAQGSRDKVFPVETQEAFFRAVRAASPGYPVRFARFESGTHGTPIRMIDWRETLNWMLGG